MTIFLPEPADLRGTCFDGKVFAWRTREAYDAQSRVLTQQIRLDRNGSAKKECQRLDGDVVYAY